MFVIENLGDSLVVFCNFDIGIVLVRPCSHYVECAQTHNRKTRLWVEAGAGWEWL